MLNIKNPIGLGVKLDGMVAETYTSITTVKDTITNLRCITVEQELNSIKYVNGSEMEKHISALCSMWTKANGQGMGVTDVKFQMVMLKSLPPTWLLFIGSLYAETTSARVIKGIIAHWKMICTILPAMGPLLKALSTISVLLKQKNPHLKWSNCNKNGHELTMCFQKGGGKEGQFPDWWRGKHTRSSRTQTTTSATSNTSHIAASTVMSTFVSTNGKDYYAFSTTHLLLSAHNPHGVSHVHLDPELYSMLDT